MKRFFAAALVLALALGMTIPAGALTLTDLDDEPVFYDNVMSFLDPDNPFSDVYPSEYFHDAVIWAYQSGITTGTSDTTFTPGSTCTRGQVVTFLWRAYGRPYAKNPANPFKDVSADAYYYDAVLWAVENGITDGTSATTFSPEDTCTNAQIITFLYRAAGKPAVKSAVDAADAGTWYGEAVAWGRDNQMFDALLKTFAPQDKCPRGNVVYFLYCALG